MIRPAALMLSLAVLATNLAGCTGREVEPVPGEATLGEARALGDAAAMLATRRADGAPASAPAHRRPLPRPSEETK